MSGIEKQFKIVKDHFAEDCNKYLPLNNIELMEIKNGAGIKYVDELWTYKMIKKFAKKSLGHNDFPQRILREFAPELATPFCDIINCALKTGIFPAA